MTSYPQIAAIGGVEGLMVYALTSGAPIMMFAFLGPMIRKRCPNGFVLTEWVRHRYGIVASLYLSACTILTLFLYMIGELTAIQSAIQSMTGLNALPCLIVECAVTTIYTAIGGFQTSFVTDNIQGMTVVVLLIIGTIAMSTNIHIDTASIGPSGLLDSNLLSGQLIYVFTVAILTNDCFMAGFWLRTFASRSDKDLLIGCSIATFVIVVFCTVIGVTGLLAVWSHLLGSTPADIETNAPNAFFIVLQQLPGWVIGFILVFTVMLSTATFDSLQSAMATTISNDLFRNKLPLIYVRLIVIVLMVPSIVVALRAPNILQIWLISDMLSAAVVPVLFLGLWSKLYFITVYEVIVSGLGGILSVFIFGSIYFGSASEGGYLIILGNGLYVNDWSVFGAFFVAPGGGLVFGLVCLIIRLGGLKLYSRWTNTPFTALDKPEDVHSQFGSQKALDESTVDDNLLRPIDDIKKLAAIIKTAAGRDESTVTVVEHSKLSREGTRDDSRESSSV